MRTLFRFILRNYFVFLFLFLEGLSFIFILNYNSFQKSHFVNHTRNISSFLYTKVQGLREYFHLRFENDILSVENARLRNLLETQKPGESSAFSITDSVKRINYLYIPARVIYNSVNKQNNFITVNRGKLQGVYPEMAVASDQSVVGVVIATSDNFATVLPVLNRDFRLSAKIKRNNYFGIIEWDGRSSDGVLLKEIPVHINIQEGDTVVTSGYSAIFPEGILVGVVEMVTTSDPNFHEVKVKLITDFRKLVHVNLIRYYFKDEQDQLMKNSGL